MSKNRDVRIERIADLPFYTEGPATDKNGNFYCTTLSGHSILKINSRNEISEWGKSECPNGQIILPEGDHLVCDSKLAAVIRFNKDGRVLKKEIEGFCSDIPIHVPNDLAADTDGNLYFTDSIRHTGKICFLGKNRDQKILASGLDYPNGLVLSADGNWLYVAESYKNRILRIDLNQPGSKGGAYEVFANLPKHSSGREQDNLPDGLAIDSNDNLCVAHYGMRAIQVLSRQSDLIKSIDTTMAYTSNLTFIDENTILMTGGYGEPGPGALFLIKEYK